MKGGQAVFIKEAGGASCEPFFVVVFNTTHMHFPAPMPVPRTLGQSKGGWAIGNTHGR